MRVISLLIYMLFLVQNANSIPLFAKKYDISCTSCHTKPPALNKMGKKFIRDGFKLSKYESTSSDLIFNKDYQKQKTPIDMLFVAIKDNTHDNDNLIKKIKVHAGGSITKSLSFLGFISSGWFIEENDAVERFFEEKTSMYYFQYEFENSKHVTRIGSMYPLAQFGEIRRSQRFAPFVGRYKKPSDFVSTKKLKGVEYSFLSDNGLLFVSNFGKVVSSNKDEFNIGINYDISNIINVGLLYNELEKDSSFIIPLEITTPNFTFNSVLFNNNSRDFIGLENTIIYLFNNMQQTRLMLNTDNKSNKAFSAEYNKIFTPLPNGTTFQITISATKVIQSDLTDNIYQLSVLMGF